METRMSITKKVALIFFLLGIIETAIAQPNQTLTNFYSVPQSSLINPGLRPESKITFGLPGLTGLHTHVSNQLFDLSMFDKSNDFQTELESQVADLTESNFLQTNIDYDLLFVGFEVSENGYLSFGASYRMTQTTRIAPDLMNFFVFGNQPYVGTTLDWSPTSVKGHHYAFYHVGYNHQLLDGRLGVGARVKIISGMGAINTEFNQLSVLTETSSPEPYKVTLGVDGMVNTSGIAAEGLTAGDVVRNGFNFSNTGFGLDLGARYQITDEWSATASVNDLGTINWSEGNENYVIDKTELDISGITYEMFSGESESFSDAITSYFDSIGELLDPDTTLSEFSTSLNRKINLGVQWRFHEKHELGVQFYNENSFGLNINAFGLSWYGDLADWFQLKVQYTAYNNGFDNLGMGFALGRGFQWHFMADYLQGVQNVTTWNEFNFRTGFSINIIGNNQSASLPTQSPVQAPVQESNP